MSKQEPVAHVYRIEANGRPCVAWDDASEIKVGAKLYAAPREWVGLTGMTLRDYFAAKAMQGLFSCGKAHDEHTAHVTAKASYLMADAMLKAREA
jgi:hypothetical protein